MGRLSIKDIFLLAMSMISSPMAGAGGDCESSDPCCTLQLYGLQETISKACIADEIVSSGHVPGQMDMFSSH